MNKKCRISQCGKDAVLKITWGIPPRIQTAVLCREHIDELWSQAHMLIALECGVWINEDLDRTVQDFGWLPLRRGFAEYKE